MDSKDSVLSVYLYNLNVLSKLEVNDRLDTTTLYYAIQNSYLTPLHRYIDHSSRKSDLLRISHDIKTLFILSNNLDLTHQKSIYISLIETLPGLDNLCGTYYGDRVTRSYLVDLIQYIKDQISVLKDMLAKLGVDITHDQRRKYT